MLLRWADRKVASGRSLIKRGTEDARTPICGERASFCQSGPCGRGSGPQPPATEWDWAGAGPHSRSRCATNRLGGCASGMWNSIAEYGRNRRRDRHTLGGRSGESLASFRKRLPATVSTPDLRIPLCRPPRPRRRRHRRAAEPRGSGTYGNRRRARARRPRLVAAAGLQHAGRPRRPLRIGRCGAFA